ncbi:TPA: hypothetical protein ACSRPO_002361 [Enterobacter asburiae]
MKPSYEELEARCAALAEENAGLKNALEWLYETVSSESVSIPDEKYSSVTNAAQVLSETPATEAVLAEVRAQGVEMFATKAAEDLRTAGGAWGVIQEPYHEVADYLEDRGESFAAQLRKEAAQ